MKRVNCGIACIKRYLELEGREDPGLMTELSAAVDDNGLSFISIIRIMGLHGYEVGAYISDEVYCQTPYLMFDSHRKHYYLIERFDKRYGYIYDPNMGEVRLFRRLFELFWCKYYLTICYNKAE